MSQVYSEFLEAGVESPQGIQEVITELDDNPDVELQLWYEDPSGGEKRDDPEIEWVLDALEQVDRNWWRIDEPVVKRQEDSYFFEIPISYEVLQRDHGGSGQPHQVILGGTIYDDDGNESELPDDPAASKELARL